jgi:hypothetical protein
MRCAAQHLIQRLFAATATLRAPQLLSEDPAYAFFLTAVPSGDDAEAEPAPEHVRPSAPPLPAPPRHQPGHRALTATPRPRAL